MARPLALLVVAVGVLITAHESGAQQAARPAAPAPVSGDGGGLATFGDRGLTPFGDRLLEGFGRRGLESFSDIPLAPMGGLEVPGPSERSHRAVRPTTRRSPRLVGSSGLPSTAAGTATSFSGATSSVASIRGVTLPPPPTSTVIVLPPVALPAVTLDHRPALASLERTLHDEIERALRRGDVDLARSLATGMQR